MMEMENQEIETVSGADPDVPVETTTTEDTSVLSQSHIAQVNELPVVVSNSATEHSIHVKPDSDDSVPDSKLLDQASNSVVDFKHLDQDSSNPIPDSENLDQVCNSVPVSDHLDKPNNSDPVSGHLDQACNSVPGSDHLDPACNSDATAITIQPIKGSGSGLFDATDSSPLEKPCKSELDSSTKDDVDGVETQSLCCALCVRTCHDNPGTWCLGVCCVVPCGICCAICSNLCGVNCCDPCLRALSRDRT
jgi:hypothetical protein